MFLLSISPSLNPTPFSHLQVIQRLFPFLSFNCTENLSLRVVLLAGYDLQLCCRAVQSSSLLLLLLLLIQNWLPGFPKLLWFKNLVRRRV